MSAFYIHGSVRRNSVLIRSNKMQLYAGIYLPQNYSICYGCNRTHHQEHIKLQPQLLVQVMSCITATNFRQRGLIRPRWQKVVALIRDMTCTRRCGYSFTRF